MSELVTLQRWLTSIMIKPGKLSDKIRLADKTYHLDNTKVVRATARMTSGQKIGIYARGYVLRLMECMEAEFPALRHLLGEELFDTFAKAYLVQVPSRSPDLYDLGKNFPAFLKASQPKNSTTDSDMFNLPVDLATLERAIAEVSRIKGLEGLENETETDNPMLYLFGGASFKASPCLVLLNLQFELVEFIKDVQHGRDAQTPIKNDSLVAISRKNYIVNTHQFQAWQWHYLQALQNSGDHNSAITHTAQLCGISKDTIMADLMLWLPVALRFGYIYSAE